MKRSLWLAFTLLGCSCEATVEPDGGRTRHVEVTAPKLPVSSLEALRVEPGGVIREAIQSSGTVRLRVDDIERATVHAPEACPKPIPAALPGQKVTRLTLEPVIALSGPASDVGFDAPFEVWIRTGCNSARRGSVSWSLEGAPLAAFSIRDSGYRVVGRTQQIPEQLSRWAAGSIVPVTPAERGSTRLTARWTSPTGNVITRDLVVSAAPRSRGLPNAALGERILLRGSGYSVARRPTGAHAEPMPWGVDLRFTSIVPDLPGRWELVHGDGKSLDLNIARYDSVPLDCGRTECHAAETHAAQNSPMTAAFATRLDSPEAPETIACTLGCHTTGEPGLADGGFSHALSDHALDPARLPAWSALPRSLRRLGGVGCLACHGPTQAPEQSAHWAILRAEVCAFCHDAPPRYTHVRDWRTTRLSRSDERPRTRSSAECARCHTTWGFLDAVDGKRHGHRMPPDDEPPMGVSCSACHAAHAENVIQPGLLRRVTLSASYANIAESALERSGACIYCHTPDGAGGPSSALIWAGQGAEDPVSGAPLLGPAPHAAVAGGCVGCHGGNRSNAGRSDHTFRPDPNGCSRCHASRPYDRSIFDRARHILSLGEPQSPSKEPPHARPSLPVTVEERALLLARLVLEDPGAAVHNPRYADLLLDRAASVLAAPQSAP